MHADMHLEILTEDSSTKELMEILLPKLIGEQSAPHTWRIKPYKGIGRLSKTHMPKTDASKRILLDQLPRLLQGYGRTPGTENVVVVIDADGRDCQAFLKELEGILARCNPAPKVLFRLAIEETEAWYFGDRAAILAAFPRAKKVELNKYFQDSVCGTWERLADALVEGGSKAIKKNGWPDSGTLKHKWAKEIGPHMNPDINQSPSFQKLRDGLRRITQSENIQPSTGVR